MDKLSGVIATTANRRAALAVSCVSSFMTPYLSSAVSIALPAIGADFRLGAVSLGWVNTAFLVTAAAFLLPFGKLGDMIGRKRVFVAGLVSYTVFSVLAALAPGGAALVVAVALIGAAAAMIFGTGVAILTSVYPPAERGRVLGVNVSFTYAGLSLGPLLGGFLTHVFGWRAVYLLDVPVGLAALAVVLAALKGEWKGEEGQRFDLAGSLLSAATLALLVYGLSLLPEPAGFAFVAASAVLFVLFVLRESRAAYPLVSLSLFRESRVFAMSNLAALINYSATFAITFFLSLYLQYTRGLTPSGAGLILITQPVCMALFASVAGRMSDSYDSGVLASVGMAIIVIGLSLLAFLTAHTTTAYLVVSLIVLGSGFGLFSSPNTNSVMGSVEKKYLGIASATVSTMRLTGQMMSMGIATLIIHVFIGTSKINEQSMDAFLRGTRVTFLVFAILCLFGVFASLARGKKPLDQVAAAGHE